jgi:hypothetical protein
MAQQTQWFFLHLNTFGRFEETATVARCTELARLKAWYESQLLPQPEYIEGWWYSFKEGPLREYNPCYWHAAIAPMFRHGFTEQWIHKDDEAKYNHVPLIK